MTLEEEYADAKTFFFPYGHNVCSLRARGRGDRPSYHESTREKMGAPFNSSSRRDLLSWSNSLPVVNHVGLPVFEQLGSGSASGGCIASVPAAPERCQHLTPSGGEETNLLLFAAYLYPFPCVATTPPRTRLPLSAHHRGLAT